MADPGDISISDVARAAGVSVSTVSRVLNDRGDVADTTRRKVQAVISQLGFAPTLTRARTGPPNRVVSLLLPDALLDPSGFADEFIVGAARAAGERGYLFNLIAGEISQDRLLGLYQSGLIAGALVAQVALEDWRVGFLRDRALPFVAVGRPLMTDGISYVDSAAEDEVVAMFEYLVSLGHRRIAYLGRPEQPMPSGYANRARHNAGFELASRRFGLEPIVIRTDLDLVGASQATLHLLDRSASPTAFVTVNRLAAAGILRALASRGRRVPDDVSVVAITSDWFAETTIPPLTHVRSATGDLGYQAAAMLVRRLAEQDEGVPPRREQVLISPVLTVRGSAGRVKSEE